MAESAEYGYQLICLSIILFQQYAVTVKYLRKIIQYKDFHYINREYPRAFYVNKYICALMHPAAGHYLRGIVDIQVLQESCEF